MPIASYNQAKLPGKWTDTILLLKGAEGYSFIIDMIDRGLYEFTICVYDKETTLNRKEYVLTCNKQALRDLKRVIDKILV